MKFKLDENLGSLGLSALDSDGHDVMTVTDQKLNGIADVHLYETCRDEWRILILPPTNKKSGVQADQQSVNH